VETGKPGVVIRRSGDRSPPAGSRGRAPGGGLGGRAIETWVWGGGSEPPEAEQVLMIIKTFWLKISNKIRHIQHNQNSE